MPPFFAPTGSQGEVLFLQTGKVRLGGAGRGAPQGVILEPGTMGAHIHHALFGADHLFGGERATVDAVGTARLDLALEQGHDDPSVLVLR